MHLSRSDNNCTSRQRLAKVLTWSGITMVAAAAIILPQTIAFGFVQAAPPDVVSITGNMRDFKKNHTDFNVVPAGGSGHYAMNVALDLPVSGRPEFRGTGFQVSSQWRDGASNPIAPHLYGGGVGLIKLASAPTISGGTTVDTWDSSDGPYGGGNVGPAPGFYEGAEMPVITVPPDLIALPNLGNLPYSGAGTVTLGGSVDLHCDTLSIKDGCTLEIDGNVKILCETMFEMKDDASISFTAGSTLEIYTMGDVSLADATINSNGFDPSAFTIYHLGSNPMIIGDGADVIASIIAPNGGLLVADDGEFFGTYTGSTLTLANEAGFHIDETMPLDACGNQLADTKGTAGAVSAGGITSAESYDEWYRDKMGTNLSMPHTIDLIRDGTGIYEFTSNEFYPIDGMLFGNQGDAHNNYFTFTFTAYFTYEQCVDQYFEFMGADDAWLFVDSSLAIDLGGIIPGTNQRVDMDRLELVDGQVYPIQFFYAHRNPSQAIFSVKTNIPLIGTETQSVNAAFD
ncbi:MAG: fibro-slime domain-containing protein [Planctomycetes bacterium]|nr:fibro-slime domain-containing protein [Planctomycetota bacterium]